VTPVDLSTIESHIEDDILRELDSSVSGMEENKNKNNDNRNSTKQIQQNEDQSDVDNTENNNKVNNNEIEENNKEDKEEEHYVMMWSEQSQSLELVKVNTKTNDQEIINTTNRINSSDNLDHSISEGEITMAFISVCKYF
jgi:hypothetical protein